MFQRFSCYCLRHFVAVTFQASSLLWGLKNKTLSTFLLQFSSVPYWELWELPWTSKVKSVCSRPSIPVVFAGWFAFAVCHTTPNQENPFLVCKPAMEAESLGYNTTLCFRLLRMRWLDNLGHAIVATLAWAHHTRISPFRPLVSTPKL